MPRKLAFTMLIGLSLMLGAMPLTAGAAALDHKHGHQRGGAVSAQQLQLNQELRKLWTDHALWTKSYLIAFYGNLPSQEKYLNRLLRNQKDIGNAIKSFYGEEAGNKLGQLLTEHIVIGGQVFTAIKEKNQSKLETANKAWFKNADDIAAFLSKANPNWSQEELRSMLHEHLKLLLADSLSIVNQNWDVDIEATDKGLEHLLKLADVLTEGIVKQFPDKF
ncbi:hypothetical protein FHS18_002896 [Paenibacillus phyllosphaerae]|uniref:Glycosyltransferase n=1 Tax=Paenibacillus phyllosphaerae TaxID=274593 RepID=A0A7W5AYI3_9BACL|nr:glycosyltransferase [Paenibacillus phyllosphaerae]MBB3110829.1 hypothetical protein [Paenibacillus phyllosphaerae]